MQTGREIMTQNNISYTILPVTLCFQ